MRTRSHSSPCYPGDLNPNNILLKCDPGRPMAFTTKLADFGLSVRMRAGQSHVSNLAHGTPYYTAPEVHCNGNMTKAADIYSFGVLLWELFHHTPPYRHDPRLGLVPNEAFPTFSPDAPVLYAAITNECLDAEPSLRPSLDRVIVILQSLLETAQQQHAQRYALVVHQQQQQLTADGLPPGPISILVPVDTSSSGGGDGGASGSHCSPSGSRGGFQGGAASGSGASTSGGGSAGGSGNSAGRLYVAHDSSSWANGKGKAPVMPPPGGAYRRAPVTQGDAAPAQLGPGSGSGVGGTDVVATRQHSLLSEVDITVAADPAMQIDESYLYDTQSASDDDGGGAGTRQTPPL